MSLRIKTETGDLIVANVGGGGTGASAAVDVTYDNTKSGIEASNVQDAIDCIKDEFYTEITHVNTSIAGCVKAPEMAEGQIATIGQVLAVKAVDDEGKPSEWEIVDQSGGGSGESLICTFLINKTNYITYECPSDATYETFIGQGIYLTSNSNSGTVFTQTAFRQQYGSYGTYGLCFLLSGQSNFILIESGEIRSNSSIMISIPKYIVEKYNIVQH